MAWLTKLKLWAIEAGAVILAILGALVYGYKKGDKVGATNVIAKSATETNKAVQDKNKVDVVVQAQTESETKKELEDKWSRP